MPPPRALVFSALERPIREVYVDGRLVVREGAVLTLDYRAAAERLESAQRRALEGVAARDRAGRTPEQAFPRLAPARHARPRPGRLRFPPCQNG